jgi:hypothetical protein
MNIAMLLVVERPAAPGPVFGVGDEVFWGVETGLGAMFGRNRKCERQERIAPLNPKGAAPKTSLDGF